LLNSAVPSSIGRHVLEPAVFVTQTFAMACTAALVGRRTVPSTDKLARALASAIEFVSVPIAVVMALGAVGALNLTFVVLAMALIQLPLAVWAARSEPSDLTGAASLPQTGQPLCRLERLIVTVCLLAYGALCL